MPKNSREKLRVGHSPGKGVAKEEGDRRRLGR